MVSRKTTRSKTLTILALFLIVTFVVFVINVVVVSTNSPTEIFPGEEIEDTEDVFESENPADSSADDFPETEVVLPPAVDLQSAVDDWAKTVGGAKGVYIYDLDRSEVAATYNADDWFQTASLYKLFVVYEGYRRVERGDYAPNLKIGWGEEDLMTCLDLAVRESYSPCAEPIWAMIGHDELDEIIATDYQINRGAEISSLAATPRAIGMMMERFYRHPDFNDADMVERMWDSFLNQPITDGYNWRQGLPSGFSDAALVYNKVGWEWSEDDDGSNGHWVIYDDAAIVEFPELDRHFVVVVMTSNVRYQAIRQLGRKIEDAVVNN